MLWVRKPTIQLGNYERVDFEILTPNLHWLSRGSAAFYGLSARRMIEIEIRKCHISYQSQAEAWLKRVEKGGCVVVILSKDQIQRVGAVHA